MPRFRFQWENIDANLREILATAFQLPGVETAHFVTRFGKRPNQEFIQTAWPFLLDHWLILDKNAAHRIAEALQMRGVGDTTISDDLIYLRSCRNSAGLRDVVLIEFIALGERNETGVRLPESPAPIPAETTPAVTAPVISKNDNPVDVLRQFVLHTLASHFEKNVITIDEDGDIIMPAGSAVMCVTVAPEPLIVRVYAILVKKIVRSGELYETLNHINAGLQIGRMFEKDGLIILESSIFPYALNEQSLLNVVTHVQFLADQYDNRLHATFGGELIGKSPSVDMIDV
ncbi:MAG: hypothetical protein DWI30_01965 [Chloroflexi bacterium]|nr:MAG: hypothetical protein DWI30_01965 [Chloroflexota bacterium]